MDIMDEMKEVALAYYEKLPESKQDQASEFFNSLDGDGDGIISVQDYMDALSLDEMQKPALYNDGFFEELDRDGSGTLDFEEVMTLFYLIESGRINMCCAGCGDFLRATYFTCATCFNSGSSFDLCCSCYSNNNFDHHEDATFVDNFVLLRSKCGVNTTARASLSRAQAQGLDQDQSQDLVEQTSEAEGSRASRPQAQLRPRPRAQGLDQDQDQDQDFVEQTQKATRARASLSRAQPRPQAQGRLDQDQNFVEQAPKATRARASRAQPRPQAQGLDQGQDHNFVEQAQKVIGTRASRARPRGPDQDQDLVEQTLEATDKAEDVIKAGYDFYQFAGNMFSNFNRDG